MFTVFRQSGSRGYNGVAPDSVAGLAAFHSLGPELAFQADEEE
jgi:hypothetical protein